MPQIKFISHSLAHISTAHITAHDGILIRAPRCPGRIAFYEEGAFFYVCPEGPYDELRAFGFSEAFITIMQQLRDQGIFYARFDADEEIVEGLPVFDW